MIEQKVIEFNGEKIAIWKDGWYPFWYYGNINNVRVLYLNRLSDNMVNNFEEFCKVVPKPFFITDIVNFNLPFAYYMENCFTIKLDFKFEDYLGLLNKDHRYHIRKVVEERKDVGYFPAVSKECAESYCMNNGFICLEDIDKLYKEDVISYGLCRGKEVGGINVMHKEGEFLADVLYYYKKERFVSGDGIYVIYKNIEKAIEMGYKYFSLGSLYFDYKRTFMPKDKDLECKLGQVAVFNNMNEVETFKYKTPYVICGEKDFQVIGG